MKKKTRRLRRRLNQIGERHRSNHGEGRRSERGRESSGLQPNRCIVRRTEAGEDFVVSDVGDFRSAEECRAC